MYILHERIRKHAGKIAVYLIFSASYGHKTNFYLFNIRYKHTGMDSHLYNDIVHAFFVFPEVYKLFCSA